MNITLDIPVSNFRPVQLKALQQELTAHAMQWIEKFMANDTANRKDLFTMPKEFESLCGCISEQEAEKERTNDPMLDAIMEKYK